MDTVDMDMDMDMVDMDIVVPGNRSIGPFMLSDMPSVLGLVTDIINKKKYITGKMFKIEDKISL